MSELKQTGSGPGDASQLAERAEPSENASDLFSTMLGLGGGAVLVTDAHGRIVWVSGKCEAVSGAAGGELRGRFVWDLAKPADRATAQHYFKRVVAGSLAEAATEETAGQPPASLERAVALAHELSQPLEAIATYAQAGLLQLRKRPVDADKLGRSFEKIAAQVRSAAEILRGVREAL